MGEFDDLTAKEKEFLHRLVTYAQSTGNESFAILCATEFVWHLVGEQRDVFLENAPASQAFYETLQQKGYVGLESDADGRWRVTVKQRARAMAQREVAFPALASEELVRERPRARRRSPWPAVFVVVVVLAAAAGIYLWGQRLGWWGALFLAWPL